MTSLTTTNATINITPSVIRINTEKECPVRNVTVYNDCAETTRLLNKTFEQDGAYELILGGLSPNVDQNSIHVAGGKGKATILEVSYHTRYEKKIVDENDLSKQDLLHQKIDEIDEQIEQHNEELQRIDEGRKWLNARVEKLTGMNSREEKGSGEINPLSSESLMDIERFLDFQRKMLKNNDERKSKEQKELKTLRVKRNSLARELESYTTGDENTTQIVHREVTISLYVTAKCDVVLEISYIILNCSWKASYDVRVSSESAGKTQLTYYGIITNQSNENWIDALFSLSTATPSLGGSPPKLGTMKVNYNTYDNFDERYKQTRHSKSFRSINRSVNQSLMLSTSIDVHSYDPTIEDSYGELPLNVLISRTETSLSSSTFVIPRKATIEADGKPHKVTIGVLDLESKFTYTAIPKLSPYAYLKATTLNTSDKQLLVGPINVFMDHNFITHSVIDNVSPQEKFDLFLGTDNGVKINYKPVRKINETQGYISKVNHENVRHETIIKNTKLVEITVYVYDQLPLSSDEKIKVKLITPQIKQQGEMSSHDNKHNYITKLTDDNNLEWIATILAKEEVKLTFEYVVEWPKGKRLEYQQV
ncbi:unnamed protein product [Didymodactylos carnosus]|uniref:Mucoidy inhibitor A n=1 Tax=Didymodactylos carnosus TaxID=1234261 RepID=A0A815E379_9BILA|nr:unnamed protein product [Didymodactylos carnosus]CAF1305911.1 unnamed protein product [Didymodactylos carnosus]CAF3979056.1 unnamed protein product [Didymodactylos carnosus]CAF4139288.1 unnamed protein product [Didymodactylos carnosus]